MSMIKIYKLKQKVIATFQPKTTHNKTQLRLKSLFYIRFNDRIYGLFIQQKKNDNPVRCEGYPFSEWLNICIQAIIAEKPLTKKLWEDNIFEKRKLIEEATEYYFIMLVLSHFNDYSEKGKYELTRLDVASLIRSNRFLDLFSMPMQDRKSFNDDDIESGVKFKCITDINNNITALFEEFDYKFPYECKLQREGALVIFSTPFMILKFRISYNGSGAHLPIDFCKFYLGFKKNSGQRVNAAIQLSIKWPILLLPKYWQNIDSIFSLKKYLHESFSSESFFNSFDWKSIHMQSRIIENIIDQKRNSQHAL